MKVSSFQIKRGFFLKKTCHIWLIQKNYLSKTKLNLLFLAWQESPNLKKMKWHPNNGNCASAVSICLPFFFKYFTKIHFFNNWSATYFFQNWCLSAAKNHVFFFKRVTREHRLPKIYINIPKYTYPWRPRLSERHSMNDLLRKIFTLSNCSAFNSLPLSRQ